MTNKEIAKTAIVEFLGTFAVIYFASLDVDVNRNDRDL